MTPFMIWFLLRILTSTFAGIVSAIKPMMPIEISTPLFPPSEPLAKWFNRAFLSPWERWDAVWYQQIVVHGYSSNNGTAPFQPLYAWLATPFARAGMSPILSLLIVSSLAGVALFYLYIKLARFDLSSMDSHFAVMLFALAPPAFILFAPYSEAVFLLAAVACTIALRQKSWWLAGLLGGIAALTRQQGILLLIPMTWELWENSSHSFREAKQQWRSWLAILLIPLGMLVWLAYRAFILNDVHVNFVNFNQFLYSLLISPSASQVVPDQHFAWPWQVLYYSFQKLIAASDVDIWVNIIGGLLFIILLAISWRKMRTSYRLYSLVTVCISFSFFSGFLHPVMGLLRHLFLAFPVFIGMAALVKKTWTRLLLLALSLSGMSFLVVLSTLNAWVP
jgi:Gpi18-like mannosyltransferase